jgi:2-desacetyl-2-hydroxyethyl bacteriochlorophyllide A dehydrogenase
MPDVLRFTGPRSLDVIHLPAPPLAPGQARIQTLASGISAGTELTAYRGTNPYLSATWDPALRLFGDPHAEDLAYPLEGWGYSEAGRVVELSGPLPGPAPEPVITGGFGTPPTGPELRVGDIVWGSWGHRSEVVLDAGDLGGHRLPPALDPEVGCFVRVGAIALNAVLAAAAGVGDTVVIFGQGVIGLLATCFAGLGGASVIAVDGIEQRRAQALELGAEHVLAPGPDTAQAVRRLTGGRGADVAIEISGSYAALREAIRSVGPDSTVIAAGFYQGPGTPLLLGQEFHHNRVSVVASQIGSIPARLHPRWNRDRLHRTVLDLFSTGRPDVCKLISHRFDLADAGSAYRLLDENPETALQVLLEFR